MSLAAFYLTCSVKDRPFDICVIIEYSINAGMIHIVYYLHECISLEMAKARHSNIRRNNKRG